MTGATRRWSTTLLGALLALLGGGCVVARPPMPPVSDLGPPPPSPVGPTWAAPDPIDTGATQPRGFGVLGPDRIPLSLTRIADAPDVEIWSLRDVPPRSFLSLIDPGIVSGVRAWVMILEAAPGDPARSPEIPPRRAVDAIVALPSAGSPRGLAIVLGSLARLNPPEQWLAAEFLRRGWAVLVSSPPVTAPDEEAGGRVVLEAGIDPEEAGRRLADEIDLSLGAWRTGLARILERLAATETLPDGPTALVGASSGALAAALVADRLREVRPLDAVAMVAGGASPPRIVARTTLSDEDLRLDRRGPRVDDHDLETFVSAFESRSRLQSPEAETAIARRISDLPILVLEAGFDAAFPTKTRRRLIDLHPEAAHWWYPLGHYGLFLALAVESDDLVDWIETVVAESPNPVSSGTEESVP